MKITIELDRIAVAGTPESNLLMRLAGMALPGDADAADGQGHCAAIDVAAGKKPGRPAKAAAGISTIAADTPVTTTFVPPAAPAAPSAPAAAPTHAAPEVAAALAAKNAAGLSATAKPYPVDSAGFKAWLLSLTTHGKTKAEIISAFANAGTGVAQPNDLPLPQIPGVVDHVRKVLNLSADVV
jgi:hypothetical protein